MPGRCRVICLGQCDYAPAYDLQKRLVRERAAGVIPDTLILLSHRPVFTIGRKGSREQILAPEAVLEQEGIAVYEADRGGGITYHGPGQLVGYPILNLNNYGRDVHRLIHMYEEVMIRTLGDFQVEARRLPGYPGVWVGDEKIGAVGIGVSNWVSYHGWALNIAPHMDYFSYITPCGIADRGVTSLKRVLKREMPAEEVKLRLIENFAAVFDVVVFEEDAVLNKAAAGK
ncbi:MAG: lipoyl(octanoyl) transferase LipB [Peptococcaceae bacterium]|nr:MAG: lipoyl(octanoyl) transferase LipB [Peptococcaceae bacterium]